eukprot:99404-Pleurochrysis_carterae.AAC.2
MLLWTLGKRTGFRPAMLVPLGYDINSALPPTLSLPIVSSYEPPTQDYSSGLCYISPRTERISVSITMIHFAHIMPHHGEGGMDISGCGRSLIFVLMMFALALFTALGESEISSNIPIIPPIRPVMAE